MNLQRCSLPLVATIWCHFFASQCLAAEALHYYRFESDPGVTADSAGDSPLSPRGPVTRMTLSDVGPGRYFPKALAGIGRNEFAIASAGSASGLLAENTTLVDDVFTIELFAHFDSLDATVGRSVLSAQAGFPRDGESSTFGWAFVVERTGFDPDPGTGNPSQPHELELWASDGSTTWLIPSGILLQEHIDYFLAASFELNGDVHFQATDLATNATQTANVSHSLTNLNPYPLLGVMWPEGWSLVDGIVDEVRFSRGVVAEQDLLVNLAVPEPTAFLLLLLTGVASIGRCRR